MTTNQHRHHAEDAGRTKEKGHAESARPRSRKEWHLENAFWIADYPDAEFDFDHLSESFKLETGSRRKIMDIRPAVRSVACSGLSAYRAGKEVLYLRTKGIKGQDNRLITDVVDYFAGCEWITHDKGRRVKVGDGYEGTASHFTGTPQLARLLAGTKIGCREYRPHEHLVELRDEAGNVITAYATGKIPLARTVQTINRFLATAEIEFDSQRVVGVSYKRVFNKSMDKGGRWYHQAQTMPKGERQGITINGERVVEKDFSALHICLAYAKAGLNPPCSDPYAIDGFDRSAVKLASLVTLNGGTAAGIRKKFLDAGMVDLVPAVGNLRRAFLEKHEPISELVGMPDIGLELQHLDSVIAERVFIETMARGIVTLGWHDSFIVQESHADTLVSVMRSAYSDVVGFDAPQVK